MQTMTKRRRRTFIAALTLIAAVGAVMLFSQYIAFVRDARDKEVSSQLGEVYGQINNQFVELSQKNWNLLSDGALAFRLSQSEELADAYIAQLREQWRFDDWLFIDANGNYIDVDGGRGYLNLGKDFALLTQEQQRIVVDGTIAGSEPAMLFAVPTEQGIYEGFTFNAVALVYGRQELTRLLQDSAYDGSSACYLIYPDGRVLLSLQADTLEVNNLFTLFKRAAFDQSDFETVRGNIRSGESGTYRYTLDGRKYYLYHQPVGFQDWVLVGAVPQISVGKHLDQILRQTTLLSVLCFGMVLATVLGFLYRRSHREITRKNQELAYRQRMLEILSSNTSNMFVVMLPDLETVEYVSSNAERVVGLTSEAIRRDIKVLSALREPDRPFVDWDELRRMPLGETYTLDTVRRHAGDGEKRWFHEVIYHVKNENIDRYIFVLNDRTQEQETQRNLKTALDIAKAANASKSAFLSNMSHDIRTPMNVIIGFMPLLLRDAENPERVREYARKISASSQHLLGLINDVLDMSRIESGQTSLNVSAFKLADVVDDLAMIVRPQANAKQQQFDIFVRDVRNDHLIGDAMKINQIMVNILSNAVKYTPTGGHIQMTVQELPQRTKSIAQICFTVSDDGFGMSEAYQRVIFDPFTRENNVHTAEARGTGLGMSIVKNLVDLMGGAITVRSELGKGSTFTVELGLRMQEGEGDTDFWTRHSITRTLVVDNDKDICENVVRTVRHSGLAMDYALSGEEAVEKVRAAFEAQLDYHLVLLDWVMPGMDGIQTAARIRQVVPEHVPILLLTAYDWSDIEREAREAGIDGFLAKPFFLSNFKETVEQICGTEVNDIHSEGRESRLRGLRCMVAEDFALNAEILTGILDMYGVRSDVCANGLEALQRFEASAPGTYDMILMDVQMPIMDGCEATRAIRRCSHPDAQHVPIIAMSANAFSEDVQKAMDAGMDAYLTKPVDAVVLEATLARIMDQQRAAR